MSGVRPRADAVSHVEAEGGRRSGERGSRVVPYGRSWCCRSREIRSVTAGESTFEITDGSSTGSTSVPIYHVTSMSYTWRDRM